MRKYTILRDLRAKFSRSSRPRLESIIRNLPMGVPSAPSSSGVGNAIPEIKVETEKLTTKQVREAGRDPEVVDIAETMPIRLIEPVEPAHHTTPPDTSDAVWGVEAVGADQSNFTGNGVSVCVLDTGADRDHPAFAGVNIVEEDFTGSGNGDAQGHGTHCAGTIFGRDVDGKRIGVARGVQQAFIGKVLGDDGRGGSEMLFNGMHWAADKRAKVISMSLGFDFPGMIKQLVDGGWPADIAGSQALVAYRDNLRVFDNLMAMIRGLEPFTGGTVVVAATGNESRRHIDDDFEVSASLPAASNDIVSVAALGQVSGGLGVASFSNTDPIISGPGVNILSARSGGGLTTMSGTSMACPHVAGIAALWWEAALTMPIPATPDNVRARMMASASTENIVGGTDIEDYGNGLAQAPNTAMM